MSENDQEINIKKCHLNCSNNTHSSVSVWEGQEEQIIFEHLVLYSFVEKMLSTLFFFF